VADDHFKSGGTSGLNQLNLGGLNDIAGITEIETLDLGGGSRRGSFSRPNPFDRNNRNAGSESKER
jgi:hypothetical protein